jgi:hypothetical protein
MPCMSRAVLPQLVRWLSQHGMLALCFYPHAYTGPDCETCSYNVAWHYDVLPAGTDYRLKAWPFDCKLPALLNCDLTQVPYTSRSDQCWSTAVCL